MEIKFLDNAIVKFVNSLEKSAYAKTLRTIDLLEKFSHKLGMPHSKKILKNLYELRIRGKKEIRICYIFRKKQIILLHSFIKKSQKIPNKEIKTALQKLKNLD
ncbi:hypothetical protein CL633_03960 [bacterium]|nr:hypothetical protein [bacterium]|tara:strand:- start:31 stop:339 length:309 start_codon:yes stop_codon:yes gene_type:complete